MLTALELERAARIRLQELLAKDWTAQANSLKTCFHEQDVVLEGAWPPLASTDMYQRAQMGA